MRFIFFIGILLAVYGCHKKELFTFEEQKFTIDSIVGCKTEDCASVEINLIKVIDNHTITNAINTQIEQAACSILNIDENGALTTVKDAIRQFNTSYQNISKQFPDETTPYEATIDCKLGFQCKSLISIAIDSYVYTGGAHGYGGVSYINMDAINGKRLSNKALFKDYNGFLNHAEKAFRVQHKILDDSPINSTGFFFENDTFSLPENIGLTDTEVILLYNPYEISSYAEGSIELKLNKQDVASYFAFDIL
ncbi:DUF4163 domain-containing protein [Aquimarina sp. 2201CG1-2-11]|uniref:DUF3298 and DUF4163 domain-containing protein n=1 Tax=Aquimarina discodermiae TaxID=3231043 RepID=UPI0034619234